MRKKLSSLAAAGLRKQVHAQDLTVSNFKDIANQGQGTVWENLRSCPTETETSEWMLLHALTPWTAELPEPAAPLSRTSTPSPRPAG